MNAKHTKRAALRPRYVLAVGLVVCLWLWACASDESAEPAYPQVSCLTAFRYASDDANLDVAVVGDFNNWSTAGYGLTYDDASAAYVGSFAVGTGLSPYRFSVNGETVLDDSNPLTMFGRDGVEHSAVDAPDCHRPALSVLDAATNGASYKATLQFQAAFGGKPLDPSSLSLTLDGVPAQGKTSADPTAGTVTLTLTTEDAGKHRLTVHLADEDGLTADPLNLPFWMEETPFTWKDALIYQILTDRFRKGGGSLDNRGITRRMGGDFAGIVEAIEEGYFQNLGANVLWISPAYTNARGEWPGFDGRSYESYHGYWPVAAREADPLWGGEDGLDELVRVAHGHGLRLILDVVPNHVHIEHPYFQEHRREWFNHPDIDCVCGRECSWTKDIEHCWFTDYLPDLDWTNTTVLNTMEDDCLWWLDRFNLDGLRIDAVAMMPRLATRHLRHRVSNTFEQNGMHVYLIGETFTGEGGRDDIRASLGPQGLSAQFDFPVMWSLRSTIGQDGGNLYDVLDALTASEESFQGSGAVMGMIVGNHDVPRFLSVANLDNVDDPLSPPPIPSTVVAYNKLALALAVILTTPGAPIFYYGDEFGMPGAGDPDNRRAMRFGDDLSDTERALRDTAARLGRLRGVTPAFRHGTRTDLLRKKDQVAYAMTTSDDTGLVVLNRALEAAKVDVDLPAAMKQTDSRLWKDCFGASLTFSSDSLTVIVPPQGMAVILKKDRCDEV